MVESIKALKQKIDESIRSSNDRIVASAESERSNEIYVSTSREAIHRSLRQMKQLLRRI